LVENKIIPVCFFIVAFLREPHFLGIRIGLETIPPFIF
jgi:hypothetical protein